MGTACACSRYMDPESFIKEVFSSSCLVNLTSSDIDNILFIRIKGGNDLIGRTNLEITEEMYAEIAQDIYDKRYYKSKKDKQIERGNDRLHDICSGFIKNFYQFININNSVNCLIFKLLMNPFTLKEKTAFDEKVKHFYNTIKCANFFDSESDLTQKEIKYKDFCNTFATYLAIVLSGYTKLIFSLLDENNCDEETLRVYKINMEKYFKSGTIKEYYSYITQKLREKIEKSKTATNIDRDIVSLDDFIYFCQQEPFVLNYFKLRENYLQFAEEKESSNIIKDNK